MKRKVLLAALVLSIGSFAFGANATDPELLKIPSLKALSEKVDAQQQKVNEAAKSSRNAGAEAQAGLNAAYTEYAVELNKQKELSSDNGLKAAIDKELKLVNEKLGITVSTQSK